MDVLILGGESPRHKLWVRRVADALKPHSGSVVYVDYKHWETDEGTDIAYEIQQAAKLAIDLGEYVIVAKSIGTVIATLGVCRGLLHPTRCVFMGLPIGALHRIPGVESGMKLLPPTTIIQNSHDPLGSAADVAEFAMRYGNVQAHVREVPGDTHDYVDFELIAQVTSQ